MVEYRVSGKAPSSCLHKCNGGVRRSESHLTVVEGYETSQFTQTLLSYLKEIREIV